MGREFVYALDKNFALDEIWVIVRRKERLEALKSECKTAIRALPLDLLKPESFDSYKGLLEDIQPRVEFLVNAAGFGLFGTFSETDLSMHFDRFYTAKQVIDKAMKDLKKK